MALRTINISETLNERLKKEENASRLVSDLLNQYYNKTDLDCMPIEELQKMLKIEQIKEEMNKRIQEVQNGGN